VGCEEATRVRVTLEWREADAEALPFVDSEFDVVLSCAG
jgi:ubiquinone/menaquinone biosynthesis C-methylase UbiE